MDRVREGGGGGVGKGKARRHEQASVKGRNNMSGSRLQTARDSYANWAEMRCGALIYTRACKGLARIANTLISPGSQIG